MHVYMCVRLGLYCLDGEIVVGNDNSRFGEFSSLTRSTLRNCCVSTFAGDETV